MRCCYEINPTMGEVFANYEDRSNYHQKDVLLEVMKPAEKHPDLFPSNLQGLRFTECGSHLQLSRRSTCAPLLSSHQNQHAARELRINDQPVTTAMEDAMEARSTAIQVYDLPQCGDVYVASGRHDILNVHEFFHSYNSISIRQHYHVDLRSF
jgi:hypothetical protein